MESDCGTGASVKQHIANWLVSLARRIDPPNKAAIQFNIDRMYDAMITGGSIVRLSMKDFHKDGK